MTMIERVAEAIETQCDSWDPPEKIARIAITAMREPTKAMKDSVEAWFDQTPIEHWETMIDAALGEKELP